MNGWLHRPDYEAMRTRLRFSGYGMTLARPNLLAAASMIDTAPEPRGHVISRHGFTELHPMPRPRDVIVMPGSGFVWRVDRHGTWLRTAPEDLVPRELTLVIRTLHLNLLRNASS